MAASAWQTPAAPAMTFSAPSTSGLSTAPTTPLMPSIAGAVPRSRASANDRPRRVIELSSALGVREAPESPTELKRGRSRRHRGSKEAREPEHLDDGGMPTAALVDLGQLVKVPRGTIARMKAERAALEAADPEKAVEDKEN